MHRPVFVSVAMHLKTRKASDDFVAFVYDVKNFITHNEARVSVNFANCSRLTFSARVCGGRPACSNAHPSAAFGQSVFKSLNIILRRCENARLTILAKAACTSSLKSGTGRGSSTMQAESTPGSGKKQEPEILKHSNVCQRSRTSR